MSPNWLPLTLLTALVVSPCVAQQKPSTPKANATATGTFVGRSGKPMAKARLFLAEVTGDQDVKYALLKLSQVPAAVADDQGRFEFKGFAPGTYAIVYQPAGGSTILPVEISIKPLLAVTRSIAPMLIRFELGKSDPFPERSWGATFALLKGHTFFSEGQYMKIWNATLRRKPAGPHVEVRKGLLWLEPLKDGSRIQFEAWSY